MNTFTIPHQGFAYVLAGRLKEGLPLIEEAVQQAEALGMMFCHAISLTLLGEAYLLAGRNAEAKNSADRALRLCREHKARGYEGWSLRLLGEIFSNPASFEPEKAENHYLDAMSLGNMLGMRPLIAHCNHGMGRLYRDTERKDQGREHLGRAITMFQEMEMNFWLEKAEKEKSQLF